MFLRINGTHGAQIYIEIFQRGVPSYETECHVTQSTNSLCSQKPPVYTKWTEEEDELLRAAIGMYGPHKWSLIAAHVPNRTPMQCSTRWLGALNPTINKGRWTPEEDSALKESVGELIDLVDSDGHPQPIPWNKIASRIPHRTGIQCQARWSEALDPSVRKGKWSLEEDEILKEGVRRYGRCWIHIAELIEGRTQVNTVQYMIFIYVTIIIKLYIQYIFIYLFIYL